MTSEAGLQFEQFLRQKNDSVTLPSYEEAFVKKTFSVPSEYHEALIKVNSNKRKTPLHPKSEHPKKTALKRHLEQEKVLVQPIQTDNHHAKKIKSDWDLLFFANNEHGNSGNKACAKTPERTATGMHKKKKQRYFIRWKEMKTFFRLLEEDELIQHFLSRDKCMQITDKYLLAMVFVYFKRAGYTLREYTRMNFFIALYLANDMEEDEEELKYEIFPWALGERWRDRFPQFLRKRDKLWARIDHNAVVSGRCCEEIFSIQPHNSIWKRNRPEYHSGAVRSYLKNSNDDDIPRGPNGTPRKCSNCDSDSQYDSASPDSVSWYVSSGESSPRDNTKDIFDRLVQSKFDMKGLKKTLPECGMFQAEE